MEIESKTDFSEKLVSKGACCPRTALGYLKHDGKTAGTIQAGVNYYRTGKAGGNKCLIVFPDVWGWNSGRVRLLADEFAEKLDCIAVVPKLQKKFREGTDDDGLPPQFDIEAETATFYKWALSNTWASIEPMIEAMVARLKAEGYTKFACAGFCWGGWAAFKFCEKYPGLVTSIGIAHPSIQLEGAMGAAEDNEKLAEKIDAPVLLMPADGDDPKLYDDEEGSIMAILKAKPFGSKCKSVLYPEMQHGWMTRGDEAEKTIERDVSKGMAMLLDHYTKTGFGRFDDGTRPVTKPSQSWPERITTPKAQGCCSFWS